MSRFLPSISLLALALTLVGCDDDRQNGQVSSYQSEKKPVVTIIPVIDNTKNNYEWSLSDEFSSELTERLSRRNHLDLADARKTHEKARRLKESQSPFSSDISWVKNAFQGDEFVVFLELVEHEELFRQDPKKPSALEECSADLNMTMRVRIFDVRGDQPKIVLQELVRDTQFIPRQFTSENLYQACWGNMSYSISPVGLAHAKLSKELSARIEDYILISAHTNLAQ
jgi:hypothetical protein